MVRTITSKVTSARKEHISKKSSLKSKKKIIGFVATAASAAIVSISTLGARVPRPKHTSILTGQRWINELLKGHPDRFHEQIGMRKHVFRRLLKELQLYHGLQDSKYVRAEEQLAIFLHLARTGLSSRMLQERFQRSADTISVYVHKLTNMFIGSFYKRYVKPMRENETPPEVASNPKLFPYFRESRGTLDGSHFNSWVSEEATARFRNRKGGISQNVLAGSDYDLKFIYILSGWEGSASDSRIFEYARREDLKLPNGCYLLADAGFPICDMLMTPYRGKRYHLKEWGRGNQKPQDYEELFNLRHSQARNVVERIFGVFKRRFALTEAAPEYSENLQAMFVPALGSIHNFIRIYDPSDKDVQSWRATQPERQQPHPSQNGNETPAAAEPHVQVITAAELGIDITPTEKRRAADRRDNLAKQMWINYQEVLYQREGL